VDANLFITEQWLWLEISVGLALLTAWGRWLWQRSGRSWLWPPLWHSLRLIYALGLPALVLFWRRALSERYLGLEPLSAGPAEWTRDLAWTLLIGLVTWLVLQNMAGLTPLKRHRQWSEAFREALYHQAHAAFYREPWVLLWGIGPGAWLGLLPLAFEALLDPQHWHDNRDPARSWAVLTRIALYIAGLLVYIKTQNLWLIWLMDAVASGMLGQATA